MHHIPKMFLLASLMLAVFMLWPEQHVSVPPPDIAEYESPPPDLDAEEPATALAQSGPLDFVPSEQIGADRAVDFPADI